MDVGGLRGRTPAASTVPEVDDGREARLARPGQMSAYPDPQELGTTRTVFKKQKRAWNTWEPDASLEVVATNQPIANRFDGSKNEAARVPLERESERLRLEATAVLDEQAELDEQRRILAPEKVQPPPSSLSSAGAFSCIVVVPASVSGALLTPPWRPRTPELCMAIRHQVR